MKLPDNKKYIIIEREQNTLSQEVKKYNVDKKNITDQMDGLKRQLYAKFGDQIHLERE